MNQQQFQELEEEHDVINGVEDNGGNGDINGLEEKKMFIFTDDENGAFDVGGNGAMKANELLAGDNRLEKDMEFQEVDEGNDDGYIAGDDDAGIVEHKGDDGNENRIDNDGNNHKKYEVVMRFNMDGLSEDKKRELNDKFNNELNEFERQMDNIIGRGWNQRKGEISNIAKRIMKCLINKIEMSFYVEFHPDNGTVRKEYEQAMKAYITGWGVLMDKIISKNV